MATDDDFIEYYPLSNSYIDSLDDSNKEKMLQEIADRNGFQYDIFWKVCSAQKI